MAAKKKSATSKKSASKRKKVARKSARAKTGSKARKSTTRKKSAAKTGKKVTRKPAAKKKAGKKKAKAKKKAAVKKKATSKKRKVTTKATGRVSKKKTGKKKVAGKKTTARKTVKKKAAASKKKASKKKVAGKKATASKPAPKKAAASKKTTRKVGKKIGKPVRKPISAARKPVTPKPVSLKRKVVKRRGSLLSGPSTEFKPYPIRRGESYMNDSQLEHFKEKLNSWKRELMEEVDRTVHHMKDEAANFPDPNDRATQESEFSLELRTRDRERKLLRKIDSALQRIKDGSYGYCEETGEEIGLQRLEARPVATLCLEAQERRELAEKQYRDDR